MSIYRKEKELIGPSGGSPSSWSLYYPIHSILGSYKLNNVPSLIDESISETVFTNVEVLYDSECESLANTSFNTEVDQTPSCSSSMPTSLSSPRVPENKRKKKEYKQELLSRIDKIGEAINTQHEEMKRMDEKMYELEVKKPN